LLLLGDWSLRNTDRVAGLELARSAYTRAEAADRAAIVGSPDSQVAAMGLAYTLERIGHVELQTEQYDEARRRFTEAVSIHRSRVAAMPEVVSARRDLAVALGALGEVELRANRVDEALILFKDSEVLSQALLDTFPSEIAAQRDHSLALNRLGGCATETGPFGLRRKWLTKRASKSVGRWQHLIRPKSRPSVTIV
jgi:hypothetical protein